MLDHSWQDEMSLTARTLQIIVGALVAGCIGFGVIARQAWFNGSRGSFAQSKKSGISVRQAEAHISRPTRISLALQTPRGSS
jgi:hypothetical protein